MTRTLLQKELRQHWIAFALLGAGTMLGYGMIIVATVIKGQAGSAFEALRLFVILMGLLAAVLLCHRLVVLEYAARTQLFLEGLPLARWRMVAIKYALGLAVMLLLVAWAFLTAWILAWRRETLPPRLLGIIALRAVSVMWCIYGFCFLLGLLGRYRVAIYLVFFLSVIMLAEQTQLHLAHFGPVALLDARFAYESETPPWEAFRITWLLTLLFFLLAALVSLVREGSVAALLAEKMSHREKVIIAALLVGLLWAGSLLSEKTKKAPFDLHDAVTARKGSTVVKVATSSGETATAAQQLAQSVATELEGAREYLGLAKLPPVFITRRRDLDADRYERGELEKAEGVSVRANPEARNWNLQNFQAWLLREVLIVGSQDRAKLESKRWVLDGFPLFWTFREHNQSPVTADRQPALRALYGTASGFAPQDLDRWLRFEERLGEEIAAGVAWSGLRTLARRDGADACQRFSRRVLGRQPPKDVRASLAEATATMDTILRHETGVTLAAFFVQWQEDLAAARRTLADDLKALPRIKGELTFLPLSPDSRRVRFRANIEPVPASPVRYSMLYYLLPAFDEEVEPKSILRVQNDYAQQPQDELPETYSRGGRLFWTFSHEVPELGCPVISGWQRQEIK
jgi:hypothetical protein